MYIILIMHRIYVLSNYTKQSKPLACPTIILRFTIWAFNIMVKNKRTITIGQPTSYDFDRKCQLKKTYFRQYHTNAARVKYDSDLKKYPEKKAYDRYQRNLISGLEKAEKKYQSRLRTAQIKHSREQREVIKEIVASVKKTNIIPTLQEYEEISDIIASLISRTRKMDRLGKVFCVTCSSGAYFWEGEVIGAGHFVKRWCKPVRRNEDNIRPQCFVNCNDKNNGDGKETEFRYHLVNEIGEGRVCRLEAIRMLDKKKVGSVLVYPKIPRHKEFIVNGLQEIESNCEEKNLSDQLFGMSSYQKAKRFAEKWC